MRGGRRSTTLSPLAVSAALVVTSVVSSLGCAYYWWHYTRPVQYKQVLQTQREWDKHQEDTGGYPEEEGMGEWLERMAESGASDANSECNDTRRVRTESRIYSTGISTKPSVCFQGSGCVIIYHIGVGRYIQEHFNLDNVTFLAASGGSIVAAMLALGLDMETAFSENCRLANYSRQWPFGPFGRILDDVAEAFDDLMAGMTDAQIREITSGGRLVLSLTHMCTMAPRLMYHYLSKKTLRDSVWCSMNLPLFMCRFRPIGGEYYMDGGLTNNAPVLNALTVRVSPTDETAHIRPDVAPTLLQFMIPGDTAYMEHMYQQGYNNAKNAHDVFVKHGFREKSSTV